MSESGVICSAICLQTSNFYLKLLIIKISGLCWKVNKASGVHMCNIFYCPS
jgi:hypothetical protein